jgi:hypothetical protein
MIGCSEKKSYENERALLNSWALSIKNKDYQLYKKLDASPKPMEQFLEMYKEYYLSNIVIKEVSDPSKEKTDSEGKIFIKCDIICSGDIIMRKDSRKSPFAATFECIHYKNSASEWLVSGRTLIRSD